jgi:Ca2+-transporting ATPase
MADKNALINRLSSVETLGATGIICTDKTGTLTENKMTVNQIFLSGQEDEPQIINFDNSEFNLEQESDLRLALEIGTLCNNASLNKKDAKGTGDPLEVALLEVARKAGIEFDQLSNKYPEVREEAFDPEVKMMATWNELPDSNYRVNVKGGPGAVFDVCSTIMIDGEPQPFTDEKRQQWLEVNRELAAEGLRIIALAVKTVNNTDGNPYEDLTFMGLAALSDPPRADVKGAIEHCYEAGIKVVMITGDQADTARYIADSVGLRQDGTAVLSGRELPESESFQLDSAISDKISKTTVFARISPQQKLNLIDLYQKKGEIVAMTGDGVNDAPALKKADIGIAMGQRGTQVAREAADMVLTDDAFSTIVTAIEQGRIIFGNIRRFIYYLMSCNVSEVFVVGLASMLGTPLPILPLQILFLNLVTDVFPALALGVGEGEKGVMQRPPRNPDEPILDSPQWKGIAIYGLIITLSVLGALFIALDYLNLPPQEAVTISFLTLAFAQLWHVFNMRSTNSKLLNNTITRNPYIWGALLLCIGLLLMAVYIPAFALVLQITPPDPYGWGTIILMSIIPFIFGQLKIYFQG